MLTAEGCRSRRQRLWQELNPPPDADYLLLGDPIHLMYLANFWVEPISLNAGFGGFLLLRKDGHAKLLFDNRLTSSAARAHVEERKAAFWYDGHSPGRGPRQLAVLADVNPTRSGLHIHDRPGDPFAATVIKAIAKMRRQKDPDEIEVLRRSMRAGEAGHAWARAHVEPGMSELDVYAGVAGACVKAAEMPAIVYGDFAVCPGMARRGGPPTAQVLKPGDMLILDFSVVLFGYRGDFTNTLVIGMEPNPEQQKLFQGVVNAMAAGERELRAGAACKKVNESLVASFTKDGLAEHFPDGHHGGHGLGLSHPEAPFFVANADETLLPGDVVTLEPGLYVDGVGGIRIEHNYLITVERYERLSNHVIALR